MKKTIFLLSLLTTITMQGQIMNVTGIERLNVEGNKDMIQIAVGISPQGDYLLLSSDSKRGLTKWDIATGIATTLSTDEGAGNHVCISDDGQQVAYSEVTYKNKRRHQAVKTVNLTSGKKQTLVKPTRGLQGFALSHGTAATVKDGKVTLHGLKRGADNGLTRPVLSRHHHKLYITHNDITSLLAPNGEDERYVWASLSPSGERVLYYVSGRGAYVCDVDGSHVIAMGDLTAPQWWDDNTIVGMDEVDNDLNIIASSIVARTLDGRQQRLTGTDVIATYPLPSPASGKIAFSTPGGHIYLINVE